MMGVDKPCSRRMMRWLGKAERQETKIRNREISQLDDMNYYHHIDEVFSHRCSSKLKDRADPDPQVQQTNKQ